MGEAAELGEGTELASLERPQDEPRRAPGRHPSPRGGAQPRGRAPGRHCLSVLPGDHAHSWEDRAKLSRFSRFSLVGLVGLVGFGFRVS